MKCGSNVISVVQKNARNAADETNNIHVGSPVNICDTQINRTECQTISILFKALYSVAR